MEELMVAPKNAVERLKGLDLNQMSRHSVQLNASATKDEINVMTSTAGRHEDLEPFYSHCPPGTHLIPIHQRMNMVQ